MRGDYLEGKKEKTAPSEPTAKLGLRVKPQPNIKRIRLTNFRPWPKQNDFELGKVTLLHGSNGVGKTSLLEAIELYYCGKTKRNPDVDETNSDISMLFSDSSKSRRFTKLTTKKYQARELNWYGKHTSYGNTLHNSFNQFNFFNSDAAFTLSQDDDREDIEEALSSLALGDDANKISKKIEQYHSEFGREMTYLENQLQKLEASFEENKNELAELEKQSFDQPIQVLKRTSTLLKAVKFKFKDLETPSTRRQVITNIRQSTSSAKALINEIDWTGVITKKTLSNEEEKCRSALTFRDKKDVSLSNAIEKKGQCSLEQQQIASSIELIKELKKYVKVDFEKVSANYDKQYDAYDKYEAAYKAIQVVDFGIISKLGPKNTLSALMKRVQSTLNKIDSDTYKAETQIEKISKKVSDLGQLAASIKKLGKDFLIAKGDATECPLCHTKFKQGELKRHIERETTKITDESMNLAEMRSQLIKLKGQKIIATKEDALIQKLFSALEMVKKQGVPIFYNDALLKTKKHLEKELKNYADWFESFKALEEKVAGFEEKVLNYERYEEIVEEIKMRKLQVKTGANYNLKKIDNTLSNLNEKFKTLGKRIFAEAKKIETENQKFSKEISKIFGPTPNISAKLKNCEVIIGKIERAKKYLLALKTHLVLAQNHDISEISAKLTEAEGLIEKYALLKSMEDKSNRNIASMTDKMMKEKSEISRLKKVYKNCNSAFKVLSDILENDSKEQAIKDFIVSNRGTIKQVFQKIHSPREFTDIELKNEKKDARVLMVKRLRPEEFIPITQISSGQRSALALSIFLTLNLKVTAGPRLLLIDDPVAHVDDLNTLSFLDYLREIVETGQRQLIFATASRKLANLFEMKFKYLDNEFVRYDLVR